MIKYLSFIALLLLGQTAIAVAAPCAGPDPSIASVAVKNVATVGHLNDYHLVGVVQNSSDENQPMNTMQSVGIFMDGQRLDTRSIPPLRAGQSYTFTYTAQRARSAGRGSTTLSFRLGMQDAGMWQNCSTDGNPFTVTF